MSLSGELESEVALNGRLTHSILTQSARLAHFTGNAIANEKAAASSPVAVAAVVTAASSVSGKVSAPGVGSSRGSISGLATPDRLSISSPSVQQIHRVTPASGECFLVCQCTHLAHVHC